MGVSYEYLQSLCRLVVGRGGEENLAGHLGGRSSLRVRCRYRSALSFANQVPNKDWPMKR